MQHITDIKQLTAGTQIAIVGPWAMCGIVTEVSDETITLLEETGEHRECYLADMGVIPYSGGKMNPAYKTYLVNEEEIASLSTERTEQIGKKYADAVAQEGRNQRHRDALTNGGAVPLSGAAGLILGF